MGFLKNTIKGALVAKVASEARKPKNQAKARSALSGLRRRISGQGSATPVKGRTGKPARGSVKGSPTKATTTTRSARKATARAR